MTEQHAIKIIQKEIVIQKEIESCTPYEVALKMAIQAIEKQIPKKPDFEGDGYDNHGNMIYDTWICPCCGKKYEVDYEEYEHCPSCGQNIDWTWMDIPEPYMEDEA